MATPDKAFAESTLTLDAANPTETLVASVNADCKRLRDLCWKMRDRNREFVEAKAAATRGAIDATKLDALLQMQNDFTKAECEILGIKRSIEQRVEEFNCGKAAHERIYLAHTAEGLPIKADMKRKTPIWG